MPHPVTTHARDMSSRSAFRSCWRLGIGVAVMLMLHLGVCCVPAHGQDKPLVYIGDEGKLVYTPDERGNVIPDFSRAGYRGGGVRLPEVRVAMVLKPEAGGADDTQRIQAAIDRVSKRRPNSFGHRGAVLLRRGTYRVEGTLHVKASGVVLRGEGQGQDGTILFATGKKKRTLITLKGNLKINKVKRSRVEITDTYVPWGATSFEVESIRGFRVGDPVIIHRPGTEAWISAICMDRIKARSNTKQWEPKSYTFDFERTVTNIDGNRIELDAPIVNAMEDPYGGGYVYKYTQRGRIEESGIENLRIVSEYEKGKERKDEAHAWTGISIDDAEHCWVRDVTFVHLSHGVWIQRDARFITVQDCAYLKPVSKIKGGRRYPFNINGQYSLVQRTYSEHGRHDQATGSRVRGPNVFLDCLAVNTHSDIGPHHRWAMGILWDNLKGGAFNAQDRGNSGTGHGWAGAQQVFWNCRTDTICVQQPPTAQNYAIGCTGRITKGRFKDRKPGHYESHGTPVEPRSLYLKQLEDRLGPQAVLNVTTPQQRQGIMDEVLKKCFAE